MKRKLAGLVLVSTLFACDKGTPDTRLPDTATQPAAAETSDILASSDLPKTVDAPVDGDPMEATVHRLSNGMTVYISTDRQKPRFNAWIAVRTGGRNDPADSTGLAHYLEHMLFKGTDELGTLDIDQERAHVEKVAELYDQLRGADEAERQRLFLLIDSETQAMAKAAIPNEFDNLYATLGINGVNAFTSEDATVYISNVPSNRLEAWARVEAERFQDPVFRLFYPELEAVYEEKNRSLDNPGWRVAELVPKLLFPAHPYGTQTVIGEVDHLKTPAYGDMSAYFDRWYQPNNIAVALAGDIDADAALPVLEEYFGGWHPQGLEAPAPGKVVPLESRVFSEIEAKGEQSVNISWLTVGAGHEDQAALVVMDMLANNSTTGLIDIELLLSQKIPSGGSSHTFNREAGYWSVRGTAKEGQTPEQVEALLMGVVAKLGKGQFSDTDVEAVKLDLEISMKRQLESPGSRVSQMANSYLNHREWTDASQDLARIQAVTRDDVLRVAKQYLGDGRAVVYRRAGEYSPPRIPKPEITPIEIDPNRESEFAKSIKSIPAAELEPEWAVEGTHYARGALPTGKFLAVKNDRNDLFSVTYTFEEGSRRRPLLCHSLELLEQSGAGELDATALRRKAYGWGTSTQVDCGADRVRITIGGIDRKLEDSVTLLHDWIATPNFDSALMRGVVENTLSQRKDSLENPRVLGSALAEYAGYGTHSDYLAIPSNRALEKAKAKRIKAELSRLLELEHDTSYFGPRSIEEAAKVVTLGEKKIAAKRRKPHAYVSAREPKLYFLHKEMAQAQIRIVVPNGPMPKQDYAKSEVLGNYLGGGMGGLIFQEMREARGLAYSAHASYSGGARPEDHAALVAFIGTQADKAVTSAAVMLELLRGKVQVNRLDRAKESVDQRYRASRIDPRWLTAWVQGWDDLGEPADPRPERWKQAAEVDPQQLQAWIDDLASKNVIVTVLGDESRVDIAGLEKLFGKAEKVDRSKLFNY